MAKACLLTSSFCHVLHLTISTDAFLISGIDGGVKMRPTPEELEAFGPEFAPRWKEYFLPRPDKPVLWMGQLAV